jgi:hypothetical protein
VYEDVDWIKLAQDKDQQRTNVNGEMQRGIAGPPALNLKSITFGG